MIKNLMRKPIGLQRLRKNLNRKRRCNKFKTKTRRRMKRKRKSSLSQMLMENLVAARTPKKKSQKVCSIVRSPSGS